MANDRVTQQTTEVALSPTDSSARTTEETAEVVVSPTSGTGRTTDLVAEVAASPTSGTARTTESTAEAVVSPTSGMARETVVVAEVIMSIGERIVDVALINNAAQAFEPFVAGGSSAGAFQDSAFQNDAFQVAEGGGQVIFVGLIDRTAAPFAPSLASIVPDFISQTATAFAPTLSLTIYANAISQTAVAFTPTVTTAGQSVPDFIDQTAAPFAPTVTTTYSISVGLINQTAVLYDPTLSLTIGWGDWSDIYGNEAGTLGFINQTAVAYAPQLNLILYVGIITQTAVTFAPTVTPGAVNISVALINQTAVVYAPQVSSASDWYIDNTAATFAPTVTVSLSIEVGRIGNLATPHAPIVLLEGPQTVSVGLINRTAVLYEPSVTGGHLFIEFDDTIGFGFPNFVFAPSVQGGSFTQNLTFARINRTATLSNPTVTQNPRSIIVAQINRTAVAFTPTVTGGNVVQSISFDTIFQFAGAYAPSVYGAGATTVTTPPAPGTPVRVTIDGIGDSTPVIVWRLTELNTAVGINGSMGTIVIRDVGFTVAEFPVGTRIDIDFGPGTRTIWTGYILRAGRRFWFDVDYPDTLQRQWRLAVVDVNVLNSRRIAYNKASPANVNGPKFTSETYDDEALEILFDDWLDLSADGLDTTTEVHRVGLINPGGQVSYPWQGSMTMGEAVRNIAQLPAAVYGINPDRQYVYADVDSENAPFVLTDEVFPEGRPANRVGYRECTIYWDFTQPINDFLAWGAGKGANYMVFDRRQDIFSIVQHGLWQEGYFTGAVWKQSTIEKVTDSAVNGSPGSRRGHKEDRMEVVCVIHENGLRVGDRVRFRSLAHSFEDVIPVRKMKMTFPTHKDVRYELTLSHEIDRWGFEDPLPPIYIPGINIPDIIIDFPPTGEPEIDDCVTTDYLIDLFTRTASANGPWSATQELGTSATEWGGSWRRDPDLVTGLLSFPGVDDTSIDSQHKNRVSPVLETVAMPNSGLVVHFDSHAISSGSFDTHGVIGSGSNEFRGVTTGDFETVANVGANAYVYYYFGGTYNATLTGSGSYEYYDPRFGSSGDTAGVSGGVAFAQVTNGYWAAALPYAVSIATPTAGAWANPVSTGRFKIRFPTVPSAVGDGSLRIKYGPASLTIWPSTVRTDLTLTTGSGSTTDTMDPWVASSSDWYIVEIAPDLYNDVTIVRIYDSSGALRAQMFRSNAGEDPEGEYEPTIGFRIESFTGSAFRFETTTLETSTYSNGEGTVEQFATDVAANTSGWGSPWETYIATNAASPAPTPGIFWSVEGGIAKVERPGSASNWMIEQSYGDGGSIDVQFQMSNYSIHTNILTVYFGRNNPFSGLNPRVDLGTNIVIVQGTGTGSSSTLTGGGTPFFDGGPVNVHIRWSTSGCKVWLWDPNLESEPDTPTHQFARNIAPPSPVKWGFQPQLFVGEQLWIGPLDGSGGSQYVHGKVGFINLAYGTGLVDVTPVDDGIDGGTNGRSRSWPFADPGDGRAYGVSWGTDIWSIPISASMPTYRTVVVWGQFGDLGPGVPQSRTQNISDFAVPRILDSNGIPFDYDLIVAGELGIGFDGRTTPGGAEEEVTAVISTYNYGNAGLPTPSYNDEFINGGVAQAYVTAIAREGGVREWHPFKFTIPRSELGAADLTAEALYHLRFSVHIEGAIGILQSAGPFDNNGVLTAHTGALVAQFRNMSVKCDLNGVPVLNLRPTACPPDEIQNVPDGVGQVSQGGATRDSETIYHTPVPYVPMSLVVYVDGLIQRWGLDFVELDPDAGTFQFTSSISETSVINTQYTTREM